MLCSPGSPGGNSKMYEQDSALPSALYSSRSLSSTGNIVGISVPLVVRSLSWSV